VWCGGGHGGLGGCGGFVGCGGLGHGGLGFGGCEGFGVGLVTTGGTTTGGTTTAGTVTGGTVTGGAVTGGTVTGGRVTGGTEPGSGTSIVTMTGLEPGGFFVPVPCDCGDPDADGGVLTTVVEVGAGVWVTAGLDGVVTVFGAGLTDGVGVLVAECGLGTMISGLPPPVAGVEPKYEPATG